MSRAKNYLSDLELGMSVEKWEGRWSENSLFHGEKRVIMRGGIHVGV